MPNTIDLPPAALENITTPGLLIDSDRMENNISRLKLHLKKLGVKLRPHLKTVKSIDIARLLMETFEGPVTVSTLKEAEVMAESGVKDITYAVGISPDKLARIAKLYQKGIDVSIILDSEEQALFVADYAKKIDYAIPVLIEIDSDGHRSGISPTDENQLISIANILVEGGAELRGVLTHAGESYNARSKQTIIDAAEQERSAAVKAASILRLSGFACPVVSVGSTPTAHFAEDLTGVTEVRAGVFVFFDLVMAGIGVCSVNDVALSVLATVIGHQRSKGWILVDAGWMAMSRDRGTSMQPIDQGYGIATDLNLNPYRDLIMIGANQEHGILAIRSGSDAKLPDLVVGDKVRILPNHACSTGAQHSFYSLINEQKEITQVWPRFSGW
jgi:D-serine deaminase-like pyridoxal phosphate-dependent protein